MKKFSVLLIIGLGMAIVVNAQIGEYCITDGENLGFRVVKTTPTAYLKEHSDVLAAINGPYYDTFGNTEGSIIVNDQSGKKILVCCSGEVRGYLYISNNYVIAGTAMPNTLDEAHLVVIGTHPLLVVNGKVHSQATEAKYNLKEDGKQKVAFRSALGTKDGEHLCMAISVSKLTIKQWANLLCLCGYNQAINLDGGPVSDLAVKGKASLKSSKPADTRMIIYVGK